MARHVAAILLGALLSLDAAAVIPESGVYWRESEPGRGYVIDYQNGTVFFVAYAYEEGRPSFYFGSGPLRESLGDHPSGSGYPVFSDAGYVPWHYVSMDLHRASGGSCLVCPIVPIAIAPVGRVNLSFDHLSSVSIELALDGRPSRPFSINRFGFGYTPVLPQSPGPPILPDLRGHWVFVDLTDDASPAARFEFTHVETTPASFSRQTQPPWEVRFVDATRNAQLVCRQEAPVGLIPGQRPRACELRVDGTPLYWALADDLSINRIQAGRGGIRTAGEAYRPGVVVGLRVE